MSKTETTPCGRYEIGFIAKPSDMAGKIDPFEPCWNVQFLYDGEQEFFKSKEECLNWIKEREE